MNGPPTAHKRTIVVVAMVGAVCNVLLAGLKIVVGTVTNSQSLVADGIHSLSDLITDAAIIVGAPFWTAPADDDHPYGHGRIETMVNILIGLVLAATAVGITWRAALTVTEGTESFLGWPALATALVSIAAKEVLYHWTARRGRQVGSRALVANAWHHRSDALSSIPVAVASIIGWAVPSLEYLDQIAAVLVGALLLKASWDIAWPCIKELTESSQGPELTRRIETIAEELEGVDSVHRIRSRRVGGAVFIDLHMLVAPGMPVSVAHDLAHRLQAKVREEEPVVIEVLAHVEPATQPDPDHDEQEHAA